MTDVTNKSLILATKLIQFCRLNWRHGYVEYLGSNRGQFQNISKENNSWIIHNLLDI